MHYFYLDSTNGLKLGLLNSDFEWKYFESIDAAKPSEIIHIKINEILEKNKLSFKDVKIISCAGPGSYTGMRLSEGLSHILKICNIETISFYQFEIPMFSGLENGLWISNAFKGEYFYYAWNGSKINQKLINKSELDKEIEFFSNDLNLDGYKILKTEDFLKKYSKQIFSKIIERNKFFESYYFRPLEEEFKPL